MICPDRTCDCGIVSDSLTVSGSGQQGDPYRLETNAYSIVTSVTRPSTPFVGQFIWETDTERQRVWTGAHWLIVGGAMPGWNLNRLETDAALTVPNGTVTAVPLLNEVEDSDGFHTGTASSVTIPAGYGGDYQVDAGLLFPGGNLGERLVILGIGSNAVTNETSNLRGYTSSVGASGGNTYVSTAKKLRLEAGATITISAYQVYGSSLTVTFAWLTATMTRHIPTLT